MTPPLPVLLARVSAVTASTTAATAPLVRRLMRRLDLMDIPNHRSSHLIPVPRGGGLACLAGVVGGWLCAGSIRPGLRATLPVLALAAIGLVDDRRGGLSAETRLVAQFAAGVVSGHGRHRGPALFALVATPVLVNVFNFMDGINGISGSTAALWGVHAMALGTQKGAADLAVIGALAAGAGVGFLPWNVPHAKLFLGDVGSYQLGAIVAAGLVAASKTPMLCLSATAPLTLYFADTGQAILCRAIRGERLTDAHRQHIYQRLVDHAHLSHLATTLLHAGLSVVTIQAVKFSKPIHGVAAAAATTITYLTLPTLLSFRSQGEEPGCTSAL